MFDIWHEDPKYPSDLTDDQWQLIQPLIPPGPPGGRDRRTSMRAVVNAIFYINRGGCAWRMLPKDYPSWETVYGYFARWKHDGTWQVIHNALRRRVRLRAGARKSPRRESLIANRSKRRKKGGAWV